MNMEKLCKRAGQTLLLLLILMTLQPATYAAPDMTPPKLNVFTVEINPSNGMIVTYANATDDISPFGKISICWNYNPDSSSNVWTTTYLKDLTAGTTVNIAAKDEAGNITVVNYYVKWNSKENTNLIEDIDLGISGYKLSKHTYIDSTGAYHPYSAHPVTGEPCIPVYVTLAPVRGGYLVGYAQLNSGVKYPLYWGSDSYSTKHDVATFYITTSSLTSSKRNATITLYVAEYQDATMIKKTGTDSMTSVILVDVTPPVTNISMDEVTGTVTITSRDALIGLDTLQFATEDASGTISSYTTYTGAFPLPDGVKYVHVKAVDKLRNESITSSVALSMDGDMGDAGGDNEDLIRAGAKVYRTPAFFCYLIGTGTN